MKDNEFFSTVVIRNKENKYFWSEVYGWVKNWYKATQFDRPSQAIKVVNKKEWKFTEIVSVSGTYEIREIEF